MFDADHPIINSSEDRLGRSIFSKYLARCMLDHTDLDSLVVGLYGGWGSGKTSIINLVIEELNNASMNMIDKEKPIILNFSPWSYSGQHQLIYSFFRRLSSTLRGVPYLENGDRIIHLLELYVSFFTQKPIPKSLRTKRSVAEKITFQAREEVYAWESGRDLTLVKAELNALLGNQKRKLIIIIDNIARLAPEEMKQIFQIVKSMGDYSNTIYLLSLDKKQVVSAIDRIDGSGGEEYIEKIVQLPFEVPPIMQQDLESILADRLLDVISMVPMETWSSESWANMYYNSLKYLFENCRDITRYVNTLHFGYSRLRDTVNPMDFFALTAIEVFAPSVYTGIRDNKDLFTDLLDHTYALDSDQLQKERLRCDEIIASSDGVQKTALLSLLIYLFPRLRALYQPKIAFYHSEAIARRLKRLCSPDLFDAYFRLSLQNGQVPHAEFETILSIAADTVAFDQALTRLNQDERITKFLDQFSQEIINAIPKNNIQSIVNALLDNGDLFPTGIAGPLSLDTPLRIHRIVDGLMKRFDKNEERFSILQNAIANASKSIYITLYELQMQSREHIEDLDTFLPTEYRMLTPTQLDSLKKLTVSKMESWAKSGRLINYPFMLPILYAWQEWGDPNNCKHFVTDITKTDRGLVAFLMATLDEAILQAMTKYEKNQSWGRYLDDIEIFIPVRSLVSHAKLIFENAYFEKLREKEQLALMIFLDLTKAETKKTIS